MRLCMREDQDDAGAFRLSWGIPQHVINLVHTLGPVPQRTDPTPAVDLLLFLHPLFTESVYAAVIESMDAQCRLYPVGSGTPDYAQRIEVARIAQEHLTWLRERSAAAKYLYPMEVARVYDGQVGYRFDLSLPSTPSQVTWDRNHHVAMVGKQASAATIVTTPTLEPLRRRLIFRPKARTP